MNPLILLILLPAAAASAADTASPGPTTSTSAVAGDTDSLVKSADMAAFVDNDFSRAEALYIEAAKLGHERAFGKLFVIYINDKNPNRISEHEARRKLAELGSAQHQIALGHDYRAGRGVEKNEAEGLKWYRKAAEQRHAWAASLLAEAYGMGMGAEQDMQEAYVWARLSEEWEALPSNDKRDSGAPKLEVKMSEQIARELSSSEKRRAEAEVKKRMEEYEKRADAQ